MSVRNGMRYPEEWQHEKDLINPLLLVSKINGKGHKPNNMPETRKKQEADFSLKLPKGTHLQAP